MQATTPAPLACQNAPFEAAVACLLVTRLTARTKSSGGHSESTCHISKGCWLNFDDFGRSVGWNRDPHRNQPFSRWLLGARQTSASASETHWGWGGPGRVRVRVRVKALPGRRLPAREQGRADGQSASAVPAGSARRPRADRRGPQCGGRGAHCPR